MPCECGNKFNWEGVCENCGLVDEDFAKYKDEQFYPFDEEKLVHHGDPRTLNVTDISLMTRSNPEECTNPDLKRALSQWDNNCGWPIVKMEMLNKQIRDICFKLHLNKDFLDKCYVFTRGMRDVNDLRIRIEDFAPAIVYLLIRLGNESYTLFDFSQIGYDTQVMYRNYAKLVRKYGLYRYIKPQDPIHFILKFVNSLVPDDPTYYNDKRLLIEYVKNLFTAWLIKKNTSTVIDIMALNGNMGLYAVGACMYLACKKDPVFKTTQTEICNICGCSEVTLREYVKQMKILAD